MDEKLYWIENVRPAQHFLSEPCDAVIRSSRTIRHSLIVFKCFILKSYFLLYVSFYSAESHLFKNCSML